MGNEQSSNNNNNNKQFIDTLQKQILQNQVQIQQLQLNSIKMKHNLQQILIILQKY